MSNYIWLLKQPKDAPTEIVRVDIEEDSISLEKMYELIGCRCIGISKPIVSNSFLVYDDEFLLKEDDAYANEVASMLYGYEEHGSCLCGNVLLTGMNADGDDLAPFTKYADEAESVLKSLAKNIRLEGIVFNVQKPGFKIYPIDSYKEMAEKCEQMVDE